MAAGDRNTAKFFVGVALALALCHVLLALATLLGIASFPHALPRLAAAPGRYLVLSGLLAVVLLAVFRRLEQRARA